MSQCLNCGTELIDADACSQCGRSVTAGNEFKLTVKRIPNKMPPPPPSYMQASDPYPAMQFNIPQSTKPPVPKKKPRVMISILLGFTLLLIVVIAFALGAFWSFIQFAPHPSEDSNPYVGAGINSIRVIKGFNPSDNWDNSKECNYNVKTKTLIVGIDDPKSSWGCQSTGATYKDFSLEADVTISNGCGGFIFRTNPTKSTDYYDTDEIKYCGSNYDLHSINAPQDITDIKYGSLTFPHKDTVKLAITAFNNHISFFVDHTLVFRIDNDSHTQSGYIGLTSGGSAVKFQNIQVWELSNTK
jgi:hypothetical protein